MIEPHHAERLGFCASFAVGDHAAVERAQTRLHGLGARHLRVALRTAELAEDAWLGWMLARLSEGLELLPSLDAASAEPGLPRFLDAHDRHFRVFEWTDSRNDADAASALTAATRAAAGRGKQVVFGLDANGCEERLHALGGRALDAVAAVGLHVEAGGAAQIDGPALDGPTLDERLGAAERAVRDANPRARLWITQAGRSTWRHEIALQAEAFLGALSCSAERVYWRDLTDDSRADPRDADAHFGIDDRAGEPKCLGRLLARGVAGVEDLVALTRGRNTGFAGNVRPVLVTGGAGFIGANLADRLASAGHHVVLYDALARAGVERNVRWLARRHPTRIALVLADLRDEAALSEAASQACAVFHLAGQVAVTTSMASPLADFEVNARGTVTLLEALRRRNPQAPLIFASTNKVYGDLADIDLVREDDAYLPRNAELRSRGIGEARPLCFHTPYGCSKGSADQYVLDYAHSFGLRTAVLRMSCIYGERQLGTEDQGWVAHFLLRAIAGEPLTIYGDGRQVRDVLHVGDAVDAYMAAWANIDAIAGRAYNLGGGPGNAISLLHLVEHLEALLGRRIDVDFSAWRPGDQRYFVADTAAIRRDLSLPAPLHWRDGLTRLAGHFGAVSAPVTEAAL